LTSHNVVSKNLEIPESEMLEKSQERTILEKFEEQIPSAGPSPSHNVVSKNLEIPESEMLGKSQERTIPEESEEQIHSAGPPSSHNGASKNLEIPVNEILEKSQERTIPEEFEEQIPSAVPPQKLGYNLGRLERECLLSDLYNENNQDDQMLAAKKLGESADIEAFQVLIDALDISNPEVQMEIIVALGVLGDPRAIPYISPFLHFSENKFHTVTSFSLMQLEYTLPEKNDTFTKDATLSGKHQITTIPLTQVYSQKNYSERLSLICNLSRINQSEAAEILKLALNDETQIQLEALNIISNLKIHVPEEDLSQTIRNGLKKVRIKAIQILGSYQTSTAFTILEKIAYSGGRYDAKEAINVLVHYFPENVGDAIEKILKKQHQASVRIDAIQALEEIPYANKESLYLQGLDDPVVSVQIAAVNSLAKNLNKNRIHILQDIYQNETSIMVCSRIEEILKETESFSPVDTLCSKADILLPEPGIKKLPVSEDAKELVSSEKVAGKGIPSLQENIPKATPSKNEKKKETLCFIELNSLTYDLTKGKNAEIRLKSAVKLRESGDWRATGALVKALDDISIDVQMEVIYALGELGEVSVCDHLEKCIQSPFYIIRKATTDALRKIKCVNSQELKE